MNTLTKILNSSIKSRNFSRINNYILNNFNKKFCEIPNKKDAKENPEIKKPSKEELERQYNE